MLTWLRMLVLKALLTPAGWKNGSDGNAQRHNSVPAARWKLHRVQKQSPRTAFKEDFVRWYWFKWLYWEAKDEMKGLKRQSEIEKQSLRKHEIKESKWIQDLSKEVRCLTGERDGALEEWGWRKVEKLMLMLKADWDASAMIRAIWPRWDELWEGFD